MCMCVCLLETITALQQRSRCRLGTDLRGPRKPYSRYRGSDTTTGKTIFQIRISAALDAIKKVVCDDDAALTK